MRANRVRGASRRAGVVVDETNLEAFWTCDNIIAGSLIDEVGAYNGTIIGCSQIAGVDGFGLQSSTGIGNYVNVSSALFTAMHSAGSITAAVYKPAGVDALVFNVRTSSGGSRHQFNINAAGSVILNEYQATQSNTANAVVPDDQWSLITWSWGPSNGRRCWVNTTEVAMSNPSAVFSYPTQGNIALLNHWYFIDYSHSVAGTAVDQMRCYSRESVQADVVERYAEIF